MTRDPQAEASYQAVVPPAFDRRTATIGQPIRSGSLFVVGLCSGLVGSLITSLNRRLQPEPRGGLMSMSTSSSTLRTLCCTIAGAPKGAILKALGTPPATVGRGSLHVDDLWYYPLDVKHGAILAIEFADSRAFKVQVVGLGEGSDAVTISCEISSANQPN